MCAASSLTCGADRSGFDHASLAVSDKDFDSDCSLKVEFICSIILRLSSSCGHHKRVVHKGCQGLYTAADTTSALCIRVVRVYTLPRP